LRGTPMSSTSSNSCGVAVPMRRSLLLHRHPALLLRIKARAQEANCFPSNSTLPDASSITLARSAIYPTPTTIPRPVLQTTISIPRIPSQQRSMPVSGVPEAALRPSGIAQKPPTASPVLSLRIGASRRSGVLPLHSLANELVLVLSRSSGWSSCSGGRALPAPSLTIASCRYAGGSDYGRRSNFHLWARGLLAGRGSRPSRSGFGRR